MKKATVKVDVSGEVVECVLLARTGDASVWHTPLGKIMIPKDAAESYGENRVLYERVRQLAKAKGPKIHPQACVDDTVTIGEGTNVWQFASVIRGAKIGKNCNIASGACIDGSEIGDGTKIGHNLAMGPGFKVGRNCFIGPNVTFCNDAWPRSHTSGFDIKAYDGRPAIIMADGASIGANAVILPGVHIGEGAMVAAGSVVTSDVPAGRLWRGAGVMQQIVGEERIRRIRHAAEPAPPSREQLAAHGFVL